MTGVPSNSTVTLLCRPGQPKLCWRTGIAAAAPAGSMVSSTSGPRNSAATTVPRPVSAALSGTTLACSCSGRSSIVAGPSAVDGTGRRPRAQSATPSRTVHGRNTQSPRNSAVNREVGFRYTACGLPTWVKRPSRMTATWSAIDNASSWSWVTSRVVTPASERVRATAFRVAARSPVSSALNGSSSSMRAGLRARARASATRCCWPPDNSLGRRETNDSSSDTVRSNSATWSRTARWRSPPSRP